MPTDNTQDSVQQEPATFAKLGPAFQEKVLQAFLIDKEWAKNFVEIFNVEQCFDKPHLKFIASKYIQHYIQYKEFPSFDNLTLLLQDEFLKTNRTDLTVLKKQVVDTLIRFSRNENLTDLPWIKEKAFEFCRQQTIANALNECVDVAETKNYEKIVEIMRNAINSATPTSPGHYYNEDIEARYSVTYRNPIATLIPQFDERRILNGGLGAGEIGIIVSPTGVGKSHFLVHVGASAIKQKKVVFHYTFELNERYVGVRYDSHLTKIPSLDCVDNINLIKQYFTENKENLGTLLIKEFPARTIGVASIRSHIERESARIKARPDLIIMDYAGLIRSSERYDLPRMEMQLVIQELRTLAKEYQVPLWTALQSNKEGAKSEIVDTTNMAESYGQAAEADFVFGLQRDNNMRESGFGNGFIAKNRMGIDGLRCKVHLDTSISTLTILTKEQEENLEKVIEDAKDAAMESKKKSAFNSLKGKIRELKSQEENFVKITM